MAVGKESLLEVHPVSGIRLASVQAGIRYADRYDLVLVELAEGSIWLVYLHVMRSARHLSLLPGKTLR